ncbi:hypothetical protein Tco_1152075 [Tanacetum coccineum]
MEYVKNSFKSFLQSKRTKPLNQTHQLLLSQPDLELAPVTPPPYLIPPKLTTVDHAEGTVRKEGPEGEEPSVVQDGEGPQSTTFYHPSKSSSVPFPSRLKKQKKDDDDKRLLSIFKKININLPFLEAMIHMPKGAKVLKYLLSDKEKLEKVASLVKLSEECSAFIQRSLP